MLKVATAKEMQEIDRITIEKYGLAGTVLMERAGLGVVEKINKLFFQNSRFKIPNSKHELQRKVIVLAGGGNNGGDGLVVARILHNHGKDVEVFLSAKPEDLKGDAKINYNIARKFGVKIYPIKKFLTSHSSLSTSHFIIVDALLGTGLSKEVRPPLSKVIDRVNELSVPVVAVDIPSGISSDTGQIMGCAIKAQYTVTFGLPKRGHMLYPGAEYTGQLFVEDIGFPRRLLESEKLKVNLVEKKDITSLLPSRPKYSHKGTYGHVLIVAGSKGKTGAALMTARACLRTGAGLVTIGIPELLISAFQSRVTEEMILPLPDKGDGTLSYSSVDAIFDFLKGRANVLAIGPGLSVDNEISELVNLLVVKSRVPIVIDADGINIIARNPGVLKKSRAPIILTPHVGEMARLLAHRIRPVSSLPEEQGKISRELCQEIEKDRINVAISFAKKTKTYLVLKGVPTIIATPDGDSFVNSTGNPGMATAGAGDVLTGMISAFLAQRLTPQHASIVGVFIHGLAGDIVAERRGQESLVATDIIRFIPDVLRSVKSKL
jgi:NAD(P)H-hydrate epimerase